MQQMRTVHLPENLCTEVEKCWGGGFSSIDDLLIFLLQELNQDHGKRLDKGEEQAVEQRLRDLGYI